MSNKQELSKFIDLIKSNKNYTNVKIIKLDGINRISKDDLTKYFDIKAFPEKYFETRTFNKKQYCVIADVMKFVKESVCDKDMGELYGPSGGNVMWRNPHYVVDFHEPMGWKFNYSDQVKIMTEIVKHIDEKNCQEVKANLK
jgi:hypothetical protein